MKTIAVLCALLTAAPALAQQSNCGPRENVAAMLTERFSEGRQFQGLSRNRTLIEIWSNPETGTWTATETRADGTTCIVSDGQMGEVLTGDLLPTGERL